MTYRMPRVRRNGLGQTPPSPSSLPSWSSMQASAFRHGDMDYVKIGDEAVLNAMMSRLADLGVIDRRNVDADSHLFTARRNVQKWDGSHDYEIRDDGPFITAVRSYWVRTGRNDAEWPTGTDFGPNTNSSKDLQISRPLYERLTSTSVPRWIVNPDGYVRLYVADSLYKDVLRNALMQSGYLSPSAPVSTKDDGAMAQALKAYYDEGVALVNSGAARLDYGDWPGGFNFGPNTNGDEIRIPEKLLAAVLSGETPRQIVRRTAIASASDAARAAFAAATIRPPVLGLPSSMNKQVFRSGIATTFTPVSSSAMSALVTALKGSLE